MQHALADDLVRLDTGFARLGHAAPGVVEDDLVAAHDEQEWRQSGKAAEQRRDARIGRLLGVSYYLSGSVEVMGTRMVVIVELVDTRSGGIVWAERFSVSIGDVHPLREQIRTQTLNALEARIPLHEAAIARLSVSESLDAWSAYHLGLQHMYRFNRSDNAAALALFERAVAQDPGFARAHAGLSFVHFQTAFMHYTGDVSAQIALSRQHATRGLELDPLDPFVNFAMGRSFWLEGELQTSLGWLRRATDISPHHAQGLYARAWTESLAGQSR